jgi:hypothetical protein
MKNEKFEADFRSVIQAGAPGRTREIKEVQELGERIGYGNLMNIASVLWAMKMKKSHNIDFGGHVATVLPCMKKKDAARKETEIKNKMKMYESYLVDE